MGAVGTPVAKVNTVARCVLRAAVGGDRGRSVDSVLLARQSYWHARFRICTILKSAVRTFDNRARAKTSVPVRFPRAAKRTERVFSNPTAQPGKE